MKTTKDFDLKVIDYFNTTKQLHPEVCDLDSGTISELIDAIPKGNQELVCLLTGRL